MLACPAESILAGKVLLISLSRDRGPHYSNVDRQQEVQKAEVLLEESYNSNQVCLSLE